MLVMRNIEIRQLCCLAFSMLPVLMVRASLTYNELATDRAKPRPTLDRLPCFSRLCGSQHIHQIEGTLLSGIAERQGDCLRPRECRPIYLCLEPKELIP